MDDFLPDVVGSANFIPPLTTGSAFGIGDEVSHLIANKFRLARIVAEAETVAIFVEEVFGFVIDDRLEHGDGRGVERTFCPPDFSNDGIDLGNRGNGLFLEFSAPKAGRIVMLMTSPPN